MISTEARLRAATRAAADTVPPGSAPPLRLPAEPARRSALQRRLRMMTPLAAAAAVAAVVIVSLTLTSGMHGHGGGAQGSSAGAAAGAGAIGGVPPYYVALTGAAAPAQAVIRATATGAVVATVTPPRPYSTFNFVTGAADDRTFILAAQRWWPIASGTRGLAAEHRDNITPIVFFRLRFDPATRMARLTALHVPEKIPASSLSGIAVSPDGSRLALALYPAQIEITTLGGGSARHWIWPGAAPSTGPWVGNNKPSGQPLSWTANGHTLAFPLTTRSGGITSVMLLDTSPSGGSLRSARPVVTFRGLGHFKGGPAGNVLITPDGIRIVTVTQRALSARTLVTEFSLRPGPPFRPAYARTTVGALVAWDVLWANPSGSTLIVEAGPAPTTTGSKVGVLRGGRFTPLPGVPVQTNNVAW